MDIVAFTLCLVGKYMQMMNVLKPIAFDVVICMSQLFDYYLFAVSILLWSIQFQNSSSPGGRDGVVVITFLSHQCEPALIPDLAYVG